MHGLRLQPISTEDNVYKQSKTSSRTPRRKTRERNTDTLLTPVSNRNHASANVLYRQVLAHTLNTPSSGYQSYSSVAVLVVVNGRVGSVEMIAIVVLVRVAGPVDGEDVVVVVAAEVATVVVSDEDRVVVFGRQMLQTKGTLIPHFALFTRHICSVATSTSPGVAPSIPC